MKSKKRGLTNKMILFDLFERAIKKKKVWETLNYLNDLPIETQSVRWVR